LAALKTTPVRSNNVNEAIGWHHDDLPELQVPRLTSLLQPPTLDGTKATKKPIMKQTISRN
jgi:hypothetical protein